MGKLYSRRCHKKSFGVSAKIDVDADELNPHGNDRLAAMRTKLKKKAGAKSKLEAKTIAKDKSEGETMSDVVQKLKGLIVAVSMMKELKKIESLLDVELNKK